ncbi:MAG: DUF3795 domain-containing protein [Candidatus Helarchaeota archaeon]|nr:DUF3795 domain-containing protein [Candidatus Helarchaeota archaeon]
MNEKKIKEMNLAAPCGMYCGTCRQYLVLKKNLLKERGFKRGCEGCRIRNKNCVFLRKFCAKIRKKEIDFCFECEEFPCENRKKIDDIYSERYNYSFVDNLYRIKEIGVKKWLKEQENKWKCPECGGNLCIHDNECYDCGKPISNDR